MGQRLHIECPETGETIPTGIAMPEDVFERSEFSANSVRCPECGTFHEWNGVDAFYVE